MRIALYAAVLVEVDVYDEGEGRCGVYSPPAAVALARIVHACPGLRLRGIQAYRHHGAAKQSSLPGDSKPAGACEPFLPPCRICFVNG